MVCTFAEWSVRYSELEMEFLNSHSIYFAYKKTPRAIKHRELIIN